MNDKKISTRSAKEIEAQIAALQTAYRMAAFANKPVQQLYAINGKINNLKKELATKKWDNHLAK